ncbi:MAG: hypothetical protein ACRC6U_09190 [Fusobacteriaceae bacterium]
MEEVKLRCKHCENEDLKTIIIKTIVQPNPEYKPFPYQANTLQYLNLGLFLSCAKCDKDTVVIIDNFYNNQVQVDLSNVPEKALIHVKFEKPLFSAIKYILKDDMTLDKVVVDVNNQLISMITQTFATGEYREITAEQYKALKEKKIEEVKPLQEVKNNVK